MDTGHSKAKTPAERKADERARKRALGLVKKEIWIYPKDWKRIKQAIKQIGG